MQNPLGPYGNVVAALLAIIVVLAAVAGHVVPGLAADPWLDSAALLAIGVVFGTQVVQNGTQQNAKAALTLASSHDARLAALEAGSVAHRATDYPPAAGGPTTGQAGLNPGGFTETDSSRNLHGGFGGSA